MENSDEHLDGQNEAEQYQLSLPQDAQRIIISFLTGRTVLKFRSVCKFWRDCVKESTFVDCHLNNALRFHQFIACFTSVDHGLVHMYLFDPTTVNFKRTEPVFSSRFHMSEPCNGIMCAYDLEGSAEILNPTTRKHLSLPASEHVPQAPYSEYFLGFVHSTKEYKVVSLRHWVRHLTFEACTIGTKSWRKVHECEEFLKKTNPVIVNDEMHWLLLDDVSSNFTQKILSFSLTDEKFSYLDVPSSVRDRDLELFEGEAKLYLLSMPCCMVAAGFTESEIWMADKTRQFWVPLYNIPSRPPLGTRSFFLHEKKLFFGTEKRFTYIDLLDGRVRYIDVPPGENIISSGMFVESFAPAVTGLVSSITLFNGSRHAGSSSTATRRSSGLSRWSSPIVQSSKRAKRITNMVWKMYAEGTRFGIAL
ncbi:hypothetical protein ABZP36_032176 [Zizania latifolia]